MKTNTNTAKTIQNGTANAQETKLLPVATIEATKTEAQDKPKTEVTPPTAEEPKKPEALMSVVPMRKHALGLDATLKVLKDLHRESIKRDNLLDRIKQLEEFEILQMEEADEMEGNHFQGCKLALYDNKGRQFVTNTSGLIKLVAEFVKQSCYEKLAEIESNLIFPNQAA